MGLWRLVAESERACCVWFSRPPSSRAWQMAKLGHREVGDGPSALTTELLLTWKPPPDALVAFVVLEQQSVVVTPSTAASATAQLALTTTAAQQKQQQQSQQPATRLAVQYTEIARYHLPPTC